MGKTNKGKNNYWQWDYRPKAIIRGTKTLKPDGTADTELWVTRGPLGIRRSYKVRTYKKAQWFESKAKSKSIYQSNDDAKQLIEYAAALIKFAPQAYPDKSVVLWVVITSNMKISESVRTTIEKMGVALIHMVAYYELDAEGMMHIKFKRRMYYGKNKFIDIPDRISQY